MSNLQTWVSNRQLETMYGVEWTWGFSAFTFSSNIFGCATRLSSDAPRNIWRKVEGRDSSSCHQGAKVQSTQYRVSSCTAATRANPVACLPFPYQYYRYKNYRSKPYFFTKNCPTPRRWGDQNLQPAQHRDTHQPLVKCLIFNFSSNNFGCAAGLSSGAPRNILRKI